MYFIYFLALTVRLFMARELALFVVFILLMAIYMKLSPHAPHQKCSYKCVFAVQSV